MTGVRLQASSYTLSEVIFQLHDHQPPSKGLELETLCKPDGGDLICVHGGYMSAKKHVSLHNMFFKASMKPQLRQEEGESQKISLLSTKIPSAWESKLICKIQLSTKNISTTRFQMQKRQATGERPVDYHKSLCRVGVKLPA